jgi:CheY-like chemotaxis protein
MAHLLSLIDTRPQLEIADPQAPPPAYPLPPQGINTASKTALIVADESLVGLLRRCLEKEGYTVRAASNTEEGMRLYSDFSPFNVVLIDYFAPTNDTVVIDPCAAQQTHGTALAMSIQDTTPSQAMIIVALDFQNAEVPRPQELMHVPILIDISIFRLRTLLSALEVRRAIEGLTIEDKLRLKRAAAFWIKVRGLAIRNISADELLNEALLLTLIGAEDAQRGRHLNRNVHLVRYLKEAMRSISTNWKRQSERETHFREFPTHDAEGREQSSLHQIKSHEVAADRNLIAKEEVARILTICQDIPDATPVLLGLYEGLKPNEIRQKYGLDETRFASAKKRIRLKVMSEPNGGDERGL